MASRRALRFRSPSTITREHTEALSSPRIAREHSSEGLDYRENALAISLARGLHVAVI
jgi:hypothetical protein